MSILVPDEVYPVATKNGQLSDEQKAARDRIYAAPLESLNPGDAQSFADQEMWWKFERLRAEDPVHYTAEDQSEHGAYWSITKWDDIIAVDTDTVRFSNEVSVSLALPGSNPSVLRMVGPDATPAEIREAEIRGMPSLLSMDPPAHGVHRGAVAEGVSPAALAEFEPLIRERIGAILDGLPIGEEFDWVDKVSMELTAMTLATLFGYPQEDRRQLTLWSDQLTTTPGPGRVVETMEEKDAAQIAFYKMFTKLIADRSAEEPKSDFISLMAHSPHMKDFTPAEIQGDAGVLLVGGNDTTRNTLTGSVYALSLFPEANEKLRANPKLIPSMVAETIRWQTPLAHMSRRAHVDAEVGGKLIKKGDRVIVWYVSGNRDDAKIERPNEYIIDRKNPRQHLSFGFGVHRCLGNRLAELQLRLTWEEILKRFPEINVVGEPARAYNNFAKGYDSMTVVIPRRY